MNLEINKKAVEESSRKFMEQMNQDKKIYGPSHIINGCRPSNIMTEEVPYFNKLSELIKDIYRKDVSYMEFITGTPSTEPSQNYEWRLEQPVNPLVNKEINYCGTCGSVLEDNKCNCSSKPVVKEVKDEIIYTPNKLEEKVNYYTPDKKEESVQYIATTDIVTTNNPVTVYTLVNSTELQELFDYCKENELTLLIDFANNKVIVDNQHFTSDSIEKSIEMALSFIE